MDNHAPDNAKKGQMELLGIALIVVIVSIGMMYLLVFMVGKPAKLLHATYVEKEMSQNFIGALLRTQSRDCKGIAIGDLLQDCANYESTGGNILCADETSSCQYVEKQIADILQQTFYRWEYSYRFRVYREQRHPIIPRECVSDAECTTGACLLQEGIGNCVEEVNYFNPEGCNDETDKETPGIQPLPLDVGTLTVMLEICR